MKFCTNCGKPIEGTEKFCGECGAALNQTAEKSDNQESKKEEAEDSLNRDGIVCPACGSDRIQAVNESGDTSGYSKKKGIIGFLLVGPLGLLFGLSKKKNRVCWVCAGCGDKFGRLEDLQQDCDKLSKQLSSYAVIECIVEVLLLLIVINLSPYGRDVGAMLPFLWFLTILFGILFVWDIFARVKMLQDAKTELERVKKGYRNRSGS